MSEIKVLARSEYLAEGEIPSPSLATEPANRPLPLSHDAAMGALRDCAATVTVLSYEEVVTGYFSLRGWPDPRTFTELLGWA